MHYHNELNPDCAQWLRNLMDADLIPRGDVDTRSIEDVRPSDLHGFTQCHFFAGIGGWPLALRLAGWPENRPVWTGSCPCQPFSAAGRGAGFADQRHLWPAWLHLIRQCRPAALLGEQVASPDALRWWDVVSSDLEGSHYASAAADLCSAGVGAAHIRQRLYWMAHANGTRTRWNTGAVPRTQAQVGGPRFENGGLTDQSESCGADGWMANADITGSQPRQSAATPAGFRNSTESAGADAGGLAYTGCQGLAQQSGQRDEPARPSAPSDAVIWLPCIDGKSRPASVEPGSFPLVAGIPRDLGRSQPALAGMARSASRNRRIRLHGYGNAIDPRVAAEFVGAVMGVLQ